MPRHLMDLVRISSLRFLIISGILPTLIVATFAPCASIFSVEKQSRDEKHDAVLLSKLQHTLEECSFKEYCAHFRGNFEASATRLERYTKFAFPTKINHVVTIGKDGNSVVIRTPAKNGAKLLHQLSQVTCTWDSTSVDDGHGYKANQNAISACCFLSEGGKKFGALAYCNGARAQARSRAPSFVYTEMEAPEVMRQPCAHPQIFCLWNRFDAIDFRIHYILYNTDHSNQEAPCYAFRVCDKAAASAESGPKRSIGLAPIEQSPEHDTPSSVVEAFIDTEAEAAQQAAIRRPKGHPRHRKASSRQRTMLGIIKKQLLRPEQLLGLYPHQAPHTRTPSSRIIALCAARSKRA